MLVVVGVVVVAGLTVWWVKSRNTIAQQKHPEVVTVSTDEPSRIKPEDEGYVWRGGPNDPKQLIVESIGVEAYVQKVAVEQNRRVAVPSNIYLTGWFTESARPGESGLSIIDGHIVDQSDQGIFTRLNELKPGDTFQVRMGDGSEKNFEVLKNDTVDTAKAEATLFSQEPKVQSQLNLITCGGTYDSVSKSYDKRVIVQAEFVQ